MSYTITTFDDGFVGVWSVGPGNKKYTVDLYKNKKDYNNGVKWKRISFGDRRYQQYEDDTPIKLYEYNNHYDYSRKERYRSRHGAQGHYKEKYTPAWFSWHYLW